MTVKYQSINQPITNTTNHRDLTFDIERFRLIEKTEVFRFFRSRHPARNGPSQRHFIHRPRPRTKHKTVQNRWGRVGRGGDLTFSKISSLSPSVPGNRPPHFLTTKSPQYSPGIKHRHWLLMSTTNSLYFPLGSSNYPRSATNFILISGLISTGTSLPTTSPRSNTAPSPPSPLVLLAA